MSEQVRIGIVGLGDHAQRSHTDPLAQMDSASLLAGCDPSPDARARARKAGFPGALHSSLEEMLEQNELDALVICSPDRFHAQALADGVRAGKHVLVEKPIAAEPEELEVVKNALQEAARAGLVVSSCHPRRFDPPFIWVREMLPRLEAQLGPPLDFHFDFFYHKPSKSGLHHGLLIDHVSHEIDLMSFLFGFSHLRAHRLFDSALRYGVAGVREDGLCFSFFGSRHLERRAYSELMRVRFQRGELTLDTETGVARVRDWENPPGVATLFPCGKTDYPQRFRRTNQDFVDAILLGRKPYLSHSELLLNTEAGLALTENGQFSSRKAISPEK